MGWGVTSVSKARQLRKDLTEAELKLWQHLRFRQLEGHKFRRQAPIGSYIVDFVCFDKGLVIELDGAQHSDQMVYDSERTSWLESQGFRVLRLWNSQALKEVEAVKQAIMETLRDVGHYLPHLSPPPQGGRRLGKGRREESNGSA